MSGELYVDPELMHNHAHRVYALGDKAAEAVSAAHSVAFNPTMFGSIGSMLVGPFMDPLQLAGVVSTEAVAEALDSTAESVDLLASAFETIDDTVGKHFDVIGKRIK